jgi:hypothetical protein
MADICQRIKSTHCRNKYQFSMVAPLSFYAALKLTFSAGKVFRCSGIQQDTFPTVFVALASSRIHFWQCSLPWHPAGYIFLTVFVTLASSWIHFWQCSLPWHPAGYISDSVRCPGIQLDTYFWRCSQGPAIVPKLSNFIVTKYHGDQVTP